MKNTYLAGLLAGASLGALAHTPAIAQDAAVEEVVVTAQRREQTLQDVSASVVANCAPTQVLGPAPNGRYWKR